MPPVHVKSTIFNVEHTFLYPLRLMSSLDARLTFRFNIFLFMEIPRRSSPLMLLAPLPRIQLFLFSLAVPVYGISLSPFLYWISAQHYTTFLWNVYSAEPTKIPSCGLVYLTIKKLIMSFFLTIRYLIFWGSTNFPCYFIWLSLF